jgi:hypothetical protein
MVAWSVEGSLEGGKEERAHVWASESHRERGGGALVKGLLALKGAGTNVFMHFGGQSMLEHIKKGWEG